MAPVALAAASCECQAGCAGPELLIGVPDETVAMLVVCTDGCSLVDIDDAVGRQDQPTRQILVAGSANGSNGVSAQIEALDTNSDDLWADTVVATLGEESCGCAGPASVTIDREGARTN